MKQLIPILLILFSCSKTSEKDIILNNVWINQANLDEVMFDSTNFYYDAVYNYKIRGDIIVGYLFNPISENEDTINWIIDSINFKILSICKDSVILENLFSEERGQDRITRLYSKALLYDSTLNLSSISMEYKHSEYGNTVEAFTIKKDTLFLRKDSGIIEIQPNKFTSKMIDYKCHIPDSFFNSIQDMVRMMNIETKDTTFRTSTRHSFWVVTINYNNHKIVYGSDILQQDLYHIWDELNNYSLECKLEKISDIYSRYGWIIKK
jgi:hypothetical protein